MMCVEALVVCFRNLAAVGALGQLTEKKNQHHQGVEACPFLLDDVFMLRWFLKIRYVMHKVPALPNMPLCGGFSYGLHSFIL